LQGYIDADYARDKDSRKSTLGYLVTFAGSSVMAIKTIEVISLSTTKAEYIATTEA